jgi:flagellar P-ring protein precursor FlgI
VETRDVANSVVEVNEGAAQTELIAEEIDLKDIVDSIKQSGASTTSLIAILEALKSAGSLKAELVVI